jgi:hypothetical protein
MELYSIDTDEVIGAYFLTGRVTYAYALDNLADLIDKLDIQRKFQNESFYKRLEIDFQVGCITPAITIAFIRNPKTINPNNLNEVRQQLEAEIDRAFILDGIQRLNTLRRISEIKENKLNLSRFLYINLIICSSKDNLLYRMVTLNNGQKPMTARHQIEILAESIYNFNEYEFPIVTEKAGLDKKTKGFKKADIINAYISFLSNSVGLDNKKIIEDKLDELVARRIIESKLPDDNVNFDKVLRLINKLRHSEFLFDWLLNGNNLIGFAVGIRTSFDIINYMPLNEVEELFKKFEKAFKNINVSKIKLSRERRKLSAFFVSKIQEAVEKDADEITLMLADQL